MENLKIIVIKIYMLPIAIDKFNAIHIMISMTFFTELKQNTTKIWTEQQKTPASQSDLEQKE